MKGSKQWIVGEKQAKKQEDIMNFLDACYGKCLNGIPKVSPSVEDMADYPKENNGLNTTAKNVTIG